MLTEAKPRRWHWKLLPHEAQVVFEVLEHEKRPVLAIADSLEMRNAVRVEVRESHSHQLTLLYDPHHNLEERIINEQFTA